MKKRKQTGLLVIVVDPETKLTEWSQIAHEGWAVVDIHIAADADMDTHSEAETGRCILDQLGVPLIAVTVDEDGIDAEHLATCIGWWPAATETRIELRVPEWDVERTVARLTEACIEATVNGIPAPLDDVIGAPDGPMAEVAAQLSETTDYLRRGTLVFLTASAIVSTHNTVAPSIVEEVVTHCAGGWVRLGDGHALADWRDRVNRITGGDDVRQAIIVGDGSEADREVVPQLVGALRRRIGGHVQLRDEWLPSELAHALAWAMHEHLSWKPKHAVVIVREDGHFADELRRAWAGIEGVPDLRIVSVDPHLGLIERDIRAAVGGDTDDELAILDARDASEPL